MKKMLPINLNTGNTVDCWNFIRLAVIRTDDRYLPWFVENFIYVQMSPGFDTYYYYFDSLEFLDIYDEVLDFEEIKDRGNIIGEIMNTIDADGYVNIYSDNYFIKGSTDYQKNHTYHDKLICGYDDESQEFFLVDINVNGYIWEIQSIQFSDMEKSFSSFISQINESNIDAYTRIAFQFDFPASRLFLKKSFHRKVRLSKIYCALNKSLIGGEITYKGLIEDKYKPSNDDLTFKFGHSIYRGYYDELYKYILENPETLLNREKYYILVGIRRVIESKSGLLFRLNYLHENNYIRLNADLPDKINKLCSVLEKAFFDLSKCAYRQDTKYLPQAIQKFKEAEELDLMVLKESRDLIYEQMKQNYWGQ